MATREIEEFRYLEDLGVLEPSSTHISGEWTSRQDAPLLQIGMALSHVGV